MLEHKHKTNTVPNKSFKGDRGLGFRVPGLETNK